MDSNIQKIKNINMILFGGLIFFAAMNFFGSRIVNGHILDTLSLVLGRDFLNFYHYGIAAWEDNPAKYYDSDFYDAALTQFFRGHDYQYQQFSYPPHYMLIAAPFALLNYYLALAVFIGLSLILYWKYIISTFKEEEFKSAFWLTPLLFLFAMCGQLSAIIAVLFVVIYNLMDKRPIIAGLLIALLTVKPQVGLLFPIFLIITGRWKVFIGASIGTIAFGLASIAIHGLEPWLTYIEVGAPAQSRVLFTLPEVTAGIMPTAFVNFNNTGIGFTAAMSIHAVVAFIAFITMIYVCRNTKDKFLQYAIFLTCTFLLTPYLMMYDMLIMVWVVLMMASRYQMNMLNTINYACFMLLPIIGIVLSLLHIPGSFLILVIIAVWISKEALNTSENTLLKSENISLA